MPPFSISPKSPLNASPRWHGKRNFIAPISTVIKRTYCTRICSSYTQTLSQVHFLFAASQTPFHHNRLVAICLMHFSIINKCHWLRSRDKPLCQGFLLESAQFKAFQCRGKLHNNYLTFPSKVLWVFVCVCEGGRKKRKDWQERSNYFEGLCIIHEKMLFQRPPESYIRVTDLPSLPILHSSSMRTRKSGHPVACDYSFNDNWCKCSSSHAYEPFIPSPGGTKLRWQLWETRS